MFCNLLDAEVSQSAVRVALQHSRNQITRLGGGGVGWGRREGVKKLKRMAGVEKSVQAEATHSHTHTLSLTLSHPLSHSLSHTLSLTLSLTLSPSLSLSLTHSLTHSLTQPLSHTHYAPLA